MTVSADISQQYIGCYTDDEADQVMTGSLHLNVSIMTVEWCQQFCQRSTYTYFGLGLAVQLTLQQLCNVV